MTDPHDPAGAPAAPDAPRRGAPEGGDGGAPGDIVCVDWRLLDAMMPLHVLLDADERIVHLGPTMAKVLGEEGLAGRMFFSIFDPRSSKCRQAKLSACAKPGAKLRLRLRNDPDTRFSGTFVPLPGGEGFLVNLSFGISVVEAVGRFHLAGSDFAATDLALEMLYLIEAKSAAMAESRKLNEKLNGARLAAEEDAASDMLTGLKNRRMLDRTLARKLDRAEPFALMQIDLDYFKSVNDTLGHGAGDHVLVEVGRILREETRPDDVVARVGGDEFVVLFEGVHEIGALGQIGRRMIARLEEPILYRQQKCRISASIGAVRTADYPYLSAERLMEEADRALYASKEAGRGRCTIYPPQADADIAASAPP